MLMKLSTGNRKNQLERINIYVDEANGKSVEMVNGRSWKRWHFPSNAFWNNIVCIVSYPTFGLGGSSLWEKEESPKDKWIG